MSGLNAGGALNAEISMIADNLGRMADSLDAYLERFGRPRPAEIAGDIDRLDRASRRIGSATDFINRLG